MIAKDDAVLRVLAAVEEEKKEMTKSRAQVQVRPAWFDKKELLAAIRFDYKGHLKKPLPANWRTHPFILQVMKADLDDHLS